MLKNKIIVKKIRNILILFMSILIMIGAYHNVRRSRAENVIEISMEVADKNNSLEKQTVTIDATETKNGVYLAELPTSVNGNRVTKYYTSDGEELEIDPASVEKITLELTEDELANKKISLGTEYDKKTAIIDDVETTLYNKEFINEDGDVIVTGYMPLDVQLDFTEIDVNALKDIRLPSDDLTVKKSFGISIQEMIDVSKTTDKAETDDTTKTDGKNQVNDTTGLAENAQTNEIEKQLIEYDSTKYGEDITIKIKQADSKEETVIYSFSDGTPVTEVVYTNTDGILSFLKNDNDKFIYTVKKQETTDNVASEEQVGDDTQDSDEVQIDEDTTTSDDSTIVNKPNNGPKKAQARAGSKVATLDTIWSHGESLGNGLNNAQNSNFFGLVPRGKISSITLLRSDGKDSSGNKINFDVSGAQSQAIATGGSVTLYCVPNGSTYKAYMLPGSDVGTIKFNSDSRFIFSYLGYESSCTETEVVKGFFDSSSIVDTSGITQARAMFSHIGRNGSMRTLTIGPKFTTTSIKDTQDMFYECGFSNMTTLTFSSNFKMENATNLLSMFYRCGYNKLTSLDLSNMTTANATSMEHMFNMCGNQSLTSLKIGFNTSKVTSMHAMFANCGTEKLTTFSLGNNFNTSNVTDMGYMFEKFGGPLTELKLGSNFSTSKVTNMQGMFSQTGTKSMKKIQLGDKFTSIASGNYSDFLNNTGASGCKIYVPGAIYSNKHAVKLSTSSSTTISYTKGYIVGPDNAAPTWANNVNGAKYSATNHTYTMNLVGSDAVALDAEASKLTKGSTIKVKIGNSETSNYTLGATSLSSDENTKTFPLTINNYTGGAITITISAGTLIDLRENKSAAKTYNIASVDETAPKWNSSVSGGTYSGSDKTYTLSLVGTDETALNNSSSTLSSSNVTVTVNGTAVSASNLTFSGQLASDSKSKAFAIGIKNFTGGEIKIVISKGALTDTSGNKEKTGATYSLTADITPPAWENATGKYNPDDQSYTITVTGTDDIELNTSASALTTSNSTLTVGGTAVTPTITKTASTSKSVTYEIKISKHTGGAISFKINEGALKDAQNNTSAEKTYTFTAVDAVKPTWASNISGGTYSNGTYTFNLVGTDNTKLNNSSSSLTSKLTIKTDSTVVSSSDLTIGNGTISSDGKTKTFPITVRNFKGGNVTISISSKALYDTTGNWSEAKTYTFFQDVTPPVWTDTIQNALYNHSTKAYKFDLVGTDETALSNSNSILNATITVGGSTASVTYGTTSFDSSTQAKTFPVTINSYTGGIIKITIAEGSLKDTANNKSIQKIYEFTPDITKPVWDYQNLAYDADSKTYSVELVGTDESALNTTVSSLITSGSSKNVTVTCGSTTVTPTLEKVITESKKIVYKLTINNYPGGAVTISIGANALIDASSNKSDAKEIKLPEKDITKPTLKVQNPSYSDTDGEYTFEVVATDEKAIDATRSSLSPSGSAQNITVKCGNVIVTPIVTIKSTTEKEIIYTVTIQKYPSGVVNVSIAEGAIYDTTGNKNAAATFTLPANDIAKPTWDDELQFNYDEGNQKITITLTGRDETSLNNSKSVLDFSNTIVTVGGSTLDEESNRVTFEEATLSADKMTKTFPITISGYTGGKIQIAIDSGALEDNSGKKSDAKEYEIIDIIKPEWKMEGAGTYNKTAKSYTLKFKGTDEAELASASLTASDLTVTVNGTAVTPTIAAIDSESDIKTKVFTVTIANFTGGEIKTIIKQGTLTDRGNNKNNEATFSVTPDITIPVWTYRSAAYTQYQGNEVSIEFTGTDNVQLVSSKLKLDTEGFIVKEGSTVIDSSRLTLNKEEYGDGKGGIKYVLKMTGYSNGSITITLPEGLLTDASGNTSNATTLTVGVIPPLDDDTPPAVSNIVEKQDKGMEAVVIDFDITDEWFDFKEAVESGEITITKTTKSYFGQGTTSDITSSCNIKITKETKLSNGKHYQVKISNIDTSTSGKYGGSNTFTITLKANSVHDLAGNGNVSTQLFNGTINFTLSSSDPAFLKYSVELDESNKTLDVVIIANTANSFFDHFKQSGQWGWRNNI